MADTPIINGFQFGWASVEAHVDGKPAEDFTEINYSTKADPGKARGFGVRVKARVRGEADHEGSFSMKKGAANAFIKRLGRGFMNKSFPITVSYAENAEGAVITDRLVGCMITNHEDSPKQGNEALMVKFDIHIMRITYDGVDPIEDK